MFQNHIEGKVDPNDRVGNRPGTAEGGEPGGDRAGGHNESADGSRKHQTIASHGRASAASESKHSS